MYGNRNLDISYRIHLHSNAAESVVNNDTMGGRTYKFNMPAVFNIDPKFQTSVVSLRTFTVLETPVKTHSAYTEPEPLVLSIRDTIADGAPARYLASSAITLGDKLGDGEFKWSASNSPFQINLETHPNLVVDTTERPTAGSVPYWNGDRHTSTASAYPGLPAGLDAAVITRSWGSRVTLFTTTTSTARAPTTPPRVPWRRSSRKSLARSSTFTAPHRRAPTPPGRQPFWKLSVYNTNLDYSKYEWGGGRHRQLRVPKQW